MAVTRKSNGYSAPRKLWAPAPSTTTTTTTTKKKRTVKSKPASKGSKTGAEHLTKTTAPKQKRRPTIKDKVVGVIEKANGVVEGKPGKKAAGTQEIRGTEGKVTK